MTTREVERPVAITPYGIGAALTQIGSYLTTYGFIAAVMVGAAQLVIIGISVGAEFILISRQTAPLQSAIEGRCSGRRSSWIPCSTLEACGPTPPC